MAGLFGEDSSPLQSGLLSGNYRQWAPTLLSDPQEQQFQQQWAMSPEIREWRKAFERNYGETPSPNDPGYDYRGAVMNGIFPTMTDHDPGMPHWGSMAETPSGRLLELKSPEHATRWKQTFVEQFGVDPDAVLPSQQTPAMKEMINRAYLLQQVRGLLGPIDALGRR